MIVIETGDYTFDAGVKFLVRDEIGDDRIGQFVFGEIVICPCFLEMGVVKITNPV